MPEEYWKYLGGVMVAVIGFFIRHHFGELQRGLDNKASKSEISDLRQEMREQREAHRHDLDRMDRIANEKIAAIETTIRDRINSMERNMDAKLDLLMKAIKGQNR